MCIRDSCNAFLGGISANYGTNVLLNDDAAINVVEADEYDRSFLQLCPAQSIITEKDADGLEVLRHSAPTCWPWLCRTFSPAPRSPLVR